jgi:hypothetical protein
MSDELADIRNKQPDVKIVDERNKSLSFKIAGWLVKIKRKDIVRGC